MPLPEQAVVYFIDLVRQRPVLWDVNRKDYSMCDVKEATWEEVVSLMEKNWRAYGPYTVASLRMLFKNKRRTYNDERKRIRMMSDQDSTCVYTGKWRYYRAMTFLEPVMKRSVSGVTAEEALEQKMPSLESFDEVLLPNDGCDENLQFRIISATSMASPTSSSPEYDQSQPESSSKRPSEPIAPSEVPFELDMGSQPAPKTARTASESTNCDDATMYFGKTVAALLRLLSPRKLVRCQAEILAVIERYVVE